MSIFPRLFNSTKVAADGLTQPQREALIDLLNFCSYADDRLKIAENELVSRQLDACQWDPAVPLELFVSRSITRVRNALESPASRDGFLRDVAHRLGNTEAQSRAVVLCKNLFRADGEVSPTEDKVFAEIERAFAWPTK